MFFVLDIMYCFTCGKWNVYSNFDMFRNLKSAIVVAIPCQMLLIYQILLVVAIIKRFDENKLVDVRVTWLNRTD